MTVLNSVCCRERLHASASSGPAGGAQAPLGIIKNFVLQSQQCCLLYRVPSAIVMIFSCSWSSSPVGFGSPIGGLEK